MVDGESGASIDWTEEYVKEGGGALGIDVDDSGSIYVAGWIAIGSEIDFGTQTLGGGGFLLKLADLNGQGDVQWVTHMESLRNFHPWSVNVRDVDVDGDRIYVAGKMDGTVDFDTAVGYEVTARGSRADAFVARYALDGSIVAAQRMGGTNFERWTGVAAKSGFVYATGRVYSDDADFPGTGSPSAFVPRSTVTGDDGEVFTVRLDPLAPVVTITGPPNNASFEEGSPITFTGTALRPGTTDPAGPITWSSSEDGVLGSGPSLVLDDLSPGTHQITASSTDVSGLIGLAGTVVIVYQPGAGVYDYASSETTIDGTVTSGSLADTHASDDSYEAITERQTGGKPSNRKSLLDHRWTFNVTGGAAVTFSVEAYHTANGEGDDFIFQYSTDDANYSDMVTVTKTADDDTPQTFGLPAGVSGTVYVRVMDTDRTGGNSLPDTIYVDDMFFLSSGAEGGSSMMAAAALPLASTETFGGSLDQRNTRSAQPGLKLDMKDAAFGVDDTTMFVSPSDASSAEPHTQPTTADAAIEELDLGPIEDELAAELAIALL
jgi:hypothetical protein